MSCCLPRDIRSFCKAGCIYREASFKHLSCPRLPKTAVCVAPCSNCDCKKEYKLPSKQLYQNEVSKLPTKNAARVHMSMQ